jgi:hypothetical protein
MTELVKPIYISSRLMAAVKVDGMEIGIDPTGETRGGKSEWYWYVEPYGSCKRIAEGWDLAGRGDANEMMATLLTFLSAFGESVGYANRRRVPLSETENGDLFPAELAEWAEANGEEFDMLSDEIRNAIEGKRGQGHDQTTR